MFIDINNYPINNKTVNILEKNILYRKKVKQKFIFSRFWVGFGAGSGSIISQNGSETLILFIYKHTIISGRRIC